MGQSESANIRVLITGAFGFVGSRLVERLSSRHPEWTLITPATGPDGLDIRDGEALNRFIAEERPDVVVHLAALASVAGSAKAPRDTWDVNLGGTLNLVLALQEHAPDATLVFVSSAEVYGASLNDGAADETVLLRPLSPYAASKAAADILVRQAAAAGLKAIILRPFNHTGPGQSDAFVAPAFASQVARIEAGLQSPVVSVGALGDERDFLDVEDVISAYELVLEQRDSLPSGSVFNIASGKTVRIGDLLDRLVSLSSADIRVEVDPARLRPTPIPRAVGDASRLAALGWRPTVAIEDTLARLLEDCRSRIEMNPVNR